MRIFLSVLFFCSLIAAPSHAKDHVLTASASGFGGSLRNHCKSADKAATAILLDECEHSHKGMFIGYPACRTVFEDNGIIRSSCSRACEVVCQSRENTKELTELVAIIQSLNKRNNGDFTKVSKSDARMIRSKLIKIKSADKIAEMSDDEVIKEAVRIAK